MAVIVEMTQLSPTMTEGVLSEWLKAAGDSVSPGDHIAAVETDKAVMELDAFDSGTLLKLLAKPGDRLAVGAPLAIIGSPGEDITSLLDKVHSGGPQNSPPPLPEAEAPRTPAEIPLPASIPGSRIRISPLARKIASQHGIDPALLVPGSGPGGRIIRADVENAISRNSKPSADLTAGPSDKIPVSMMRAAIARRLTESVTMAPHFYLTRRIMADRLLQFRQELNKAQEVVAEATGLPAIRVSVNDLILKAAGKALISHPAIRSSWQREFIEIHNRYDIAFAVAIPDGLITPVVRDIVNLSIPEVATKTRDLSERARNRTLNTAEYIGSVFTVSNLGMMGIREFTAIINPPESAILAVGEVRQEPEFNQATGSFSPQSVMMVTLSCDHRVIDGASGAAFLKTMAEYLESPLTLV